MSDLRRRNWIGICRGGVSVSDVWRRSCIGVCRGGVCVSDLWHRTAIILGFAGDASVLVICVK